MEGGKGRKVLLCSLPSGAWKEKERKLPANSSSDEGDEEAKGLRYNKVNCISEILGVTGKEREKSPPIFDGRVEKQESKGRKKRMRKWHQELMQPYWE